MRKFIGVLCSILAIAIALVLILFGGEDGLEILDDHTHVSAEPVIENAVDATCSSAGSYDQVTYCSDPDCKSEITRISKSVDPLPHRYANGVCSVCGKNEKYSSGLAYTSLGDGSCFVSGVGSCTDRHISIPPTSPLGETVTGIDDSAFFSLTSIESVALPAGVKYIGTNAFAGCSNLSSINLGASITTIGNFAFENCKSITAVRLPSVESIGVSAFKNCEKLYILVLGESLNAIGDYAFQDCRLLDNIMIPDGVISVGKGAFKSCWRITEITLGESLVSIGDNAFSSCSSITEIIIPDGVESVGKGAFSYCDRLANVTLGRALESIGDGIFDYCRSLENIAVSAENAYYKALDGSLYTKDGKKLIKYAIAKPNETFKIPDEVEIIGANAFFMCRSLTSIEIPAGVIAIRDKAFSSCDKLVQICYGGSRDSWDSITKGEDWDSYTTDYSIVYNYIGG